MNVLVTGVAGFLGSRIAHRFCEQHHVIGLYHDHGPNRAPWLAMSAVQANINDYHRLLEIIVDCEIDQIYHCAAKSIVRNCRCDPLGCFQTNVMGTANLLEAARQSERVQGILCAESDKSYGPGPVPYVEDQALLPGGVYEVSKACAGHVARTYYHNYDLPVFTVRSANVFGPGDRHATRLIPNTIMRLLRGEAPQITASAAGFLREWIYVDDYLDIVTSLMEKRPWGEAVNVGSGQTQTVAELIAMICDLMEVDYRPQDWVRPQTLIEIPRQVLSLKKLNQLLPKMKTPTPLREGLRRTIEWHRLSEAIPCVN